MDRWDQLLASINHNRPVTHEEMVKEVVSCVAATRRYTIAYSPHLIVTYRTYQAHGERIVEEVVRCRRPCFFPFVIMPEHHVLTLMRHEQGITAEDTDLDSERTEYCFDWCMHKLGFLITYNILPFWRTRWRFPLAAK
jgi:hypothetical protein